MTRVLLTGAGGFVGSHILHKILQDTDWDVVCPVTYTHTGTGSRIDSVVKPHQWHRVLIHHHDLTLPVDRVTAHTWGPIDVMMNVASESHVDRSITAPGSFIGNNVALMTNALDYALQENVKLFLHMSTDEVYGPADIIDHPRGHQEWSTILPSNPYSASKAAQEAIAFSYWRTYGLPLVITNTMNIIGERQNPEKFVPKTVHAISEGRPVTVHADRNGNPGSRFYLHASDLADAWVWLTERTLNDDSSLLQTHEKGFNRPARYNIVGTHEINNLAMVKRIAEMMYRHPTNFTYKIVDFHQSRPGHDRRYALNGNKLTQAGWTPKPFYHQLRTTIRWYLDNPEWMTL